MRLPSTSVICLVLLFMPLSFAAGLPSRRTATQVVVSSLSRTIAVGNNTYYLADEPVATVPSFKTQGSIIPFASFSSNTSNISGSSLQSAVTSWLDLDDVFTEDFMGAVLLQHTGKGSARLESSAESFFKQQGTQTLLTSPGVSAAGIPIAATSLNIATLPPGPYVLAPDASGTPAIYAPYRLFFDDSQSFFKSLTHKSDGSFAVVSATGDTDSSPYVAAPSRLYALGADKTKLPFAGLRVSVKDIYYLQGIRASGGNRHYYSLYAPRNATGPAVSRILELGGNIVGSTKTVQFANGDRATADWVDYHAPFVIRADGNREPSGSSTGAAAGISRLDFLDIAIGTDTGGSIRGPSGVNGLYGIRPSVGAISLDNVIPLSDVLDTGGFIARDPKLFATWGKNWYAGSFESFPAFPKTLLVSNDFEDVSAPALAIYNDFFGKLQTFLGTGTTLTRNFSVTSAWNASAPVDVPLNEWLNTTYPTLIAFHQWNAVGAPFFADYAAVNGGRNPHINPGVLLRWKFGISQGESGFNEAKIQQATFENWTSEHFLTENTQSCSDAIYLYPQNAGQYTSREIYYPNAGSPPFGFGSSRIASHARCPDVVVPIGQVPFNSTISNITEQLPVTVSFVARRGCDFMLFDLLDALSDAGIVYTVKTGRTAF